MQEMNRRRRRRAPLKSHSFIEVSGIKFFSFAKRAPRYREAVLSIHIHINVKKSIEDSVGNLSLCVNAI